MRRYGVMVAWNDKQFPQTTKKKELFVSSQTVDKALLLQGFAILLEPLF